MHIKLIEKHQFQTSSWSGGTTTQLYISPPHATYTECNFDFRVSSAEVELDESTFTTLPGIDRKLMILAGEINITHNEHDSKHLKQYDIDAFKGDWHTTAIGRCTDFNVMTKGNLESGLSHIRLTCTDRKEIQLAATCTTICIYVISGSFEIEINENNYDIAPENLMVIEKPSVLPLFLQANSLCEILLISINKTD
jgi:environmental stress-induced protein Ves